MIPESLQLLSRAFPAIQQKESRRTNLSSKQTYSTLFTLPTTGTITTAHDKDKDLPTCYYAGSLHSTSLSKRTLFIDARTLCADSVLWNSLAQVLTFLNSLLIWWELPLTCKQPLKIVSILWQRDKTNQLGPGFQSTCTLLYGLTVVGPHVCDFDSSSQSQRGMDACFVFLKNTSQGRY